MVGHGGGEHLASRQCADGEPRIHAHQRSNTCQDIPEETVQQRTKEKAMSLDSTSRPPVPPFTCATATQKVRLAEDVWNTRDPARVALAYTLDSTWRNRSEFLVSSEIGRASCRERV